MKQLLASLLVLAMCAPAMALTFSLSDGGDGKMVIAYDLDQAAAEGIRGLALTVTRTSGDAAVAASTDFATAFNTFIDFAADVDNSYSAVGQGHPFALITPDVVNGEYEVETFPASSFALSMGYLAPANQLALTEDGTIEVQFTLTEDSCFTVALDTLRGGAVGDNLTVNAAGLGNVCLAAPVTDCVKSTASFYSAWVAWGKPACWCYQKNCRGDLNGSSFLGKPVTSADLTLFKNAYNKSDADLALVANGICADINRSAFLGKRVTSADLTEFKKYYNLAEASVPVCDMTNYNFWTN
jgi:hypothetical protein